MFRISFDRSLKMLKTLFVCAYAYVSIGLCMHLYPCVHIHDSCIRRLSSLGSLHAYASVFYSLHGCIIQPAYLCGIPSYVDVGWYAHASTQQPYSTTILMLYFHLFVGFARIFRYGQHQLCRFMIPNLD